MPIEVMDLVEMAKEGKRKVIFNTKKFHAWVHVYPEPGDKDDMHCHNADQTFYVIDGECTMHFPDGGKAVMKPGMVATITGGSFYQQRLARALDCSHSVHGGRRSSKISISALRWAGGPVEQLPQGAKS